MKSYRKIEGTSSYCLTFQAGHGGNGLVYICYKSNSNGLPDGGSGGRGGNVYLQLDNNINTLSSILLPGQQGINGDPGERSGRHGANGKDIHILVPTGTHAYHKIDGDEELLIGYISSAHPKLLIAVGGKGGNGNHLDRKCETLERTGGLPGETASVILKHIIASDILIVGPVNSGKSLLFNKLIGRDLSPSDSYLYTTKKPILGSMHYYTYQRPLVLIDTPSEHLSEGQLTFLIKGASSIIITVRLPEDINHIRDILHLSVYNLVINTVDSSKQKVYLVLNTDDECSPDYIGLAEIQTYCSLYQCNLANPKLSLSSIIRDIYSDLFHEDYSTEDIAHEYQEQEGVIRPCKIFKC